jgi:hypothetical protein
MEWMRGNAASLRRHPVIIPTVSCMRAGLADGMVAQILVDSAASKIV